MKPQRVAYIVKRFPKLSETFIVEELAELQRRGVEVRICSLKPPMESLQHGVVKRSGLLERTTYGLDGVQTLFARFRPQLIHAHFATQPAEVAQTLAAELDVPFTFTAHGYDVYRKPPSDFAARAAAASEVITVSQANADFMHDKFGVERDAVRVIPCGIDISRFTPGMHRCDPPIVLCVARMSPVKNLELLLRGCWLLKRDGVSFRCVLVGEGRCRPALEGLRTSLGLESTVLFAGALDQDGVVESWKRASVGVLTSHSEGMPVCLMEAAACGVPVVATNVGGVRELVQDGTTGLVVPADDPDALAISLGLLLTNPRLANRMGLSARTRAESCFSVARQVDSLLAVWSQACSRKVKA